MAAVTVRIQGRVQGVGYRYWVARQAGLIGIDGWVRNRRDGSVEAVFSGKDNALKKMLGATHFVLARPALGQGNPPVTNHG